MCVLAGNLRAGGCWVGNVCEKTVAAFTVIASLHQLKLKIQRRHSVPSLILFHWPLQIGYFLTFKEPRNQF